MAHKQKHVTCYAKSSSLAINNSGITMKTYVKAIFLYTAMSFTNHSIAGGWQQATTIDQYIIEGSSAGERIYVKFNDGFNPDSCVGNGTEWSRIYGDTQKGKYLLSTILNAKATGQTVVPMLHGCDDWGRPRLTGLLIQ